MMSHCHMTSFRNVLATIVQVYAIIANEPLTGMICTCHLVLTPVLGSLQNFNTINN